MFPKTVLVSTGEGEATGNLFSSLCSPILFLWKFMKKETNNALIKDIQDALFEPELKLDALVTIRGILMRLNTYYTLCV